LLSFTLLQQFRPLACFKDKTSCKFFKGLFPLVIVAILADGNPSTNFAEATGDLRQICKWVATTSSNLTNLYETLRSMPSGHSQSLAKLLQFVIFFLA
jgi:hypothetical protein